MRVTVVTSDGSDVAVHSMPDADVAQLIDAWLDAEPVLTLTLGQRTVCHVAAAHVVRVDVQPETRLHRALRWAQAFLRRS